MRSAVVTFVVAAIAIGMGSAGAAQRPPVVRVARLDPVTVQGARFRARERVTVTYTGSARRTRVVVTSAEWLVQRAVHRRHGRSVHRLLAQRSRRLGRPRHCAAQAAPGLPAGVSAY